MYILYLLAVYYTYYINRGILFLIFPTMDWNYNQLIIETTKITQNCTFQNENN